MLNGKLLELNQNPITRGKAILKGINKINNKAITISTTPGTVLTKEPCPGLIHWTLPNQEIACQYCIQIEEPLTNLNPFFHLMSSSVLNPLKAYLFNKINHFRDTDKSDIRPSFAQALNTMWNCSTFHYTEKDIVDAYRKSLRSLNHTLSEALEAQRLYSGEITVRATTPPPRSTQTKLTPESCSAYLSDVRAGAHHTRRTLTFY